MGSCNSKIGPSLVNQPNYITKAENFVKSPPKFTNSPKSPSKCNFIFFSNGQLQFKNWPSLVTQAIYITKTEKVVKSQKNTPTKSAI